jgi:hypothetical protein
MSAFDPDDIMTVFNASRPLSRREVDELERLDIPPDALAGSIPVVSSNVNFDGDRFEFEHHHRRYDEEGVHAFLFLVINPWNEAIDIVAWSTSLGKLATWLGRAWALGEETIRHPRLTDHEGLQVHRTPVGWLKAQRKGICLVRPQAAVHHLDDAGPFIPEDINHLVELKRLLLRPEPRFLVDADKLALSASIKDFENDCVR